MYSKKLSYDSQQDGQDEDVVSKYIKLFMGPNEPEIPARNTLDHKKYLLNKYTFTHGKKPPPLVTHGQSRYVGIRYHKDSKDESKIQTFSTPLLSHEIYDTPIAFDELFNTKNLDEIEDMIQGENPELKKRRRHKHTEGLSAPPPLWKKNEELVRKWQAEAENRNKLMTKSKDEADGPPSSKEAPDRSPVKETIPASLTEDRKIIKDVRLGILKKEIGKQFVKQRIAVKTQAKAWGQLKPKKQKRKEPITFFQLLKRAWLSSKGTRENSTTLKMLLANKDIQDKIRKNKIKWPMRIPPARCLSDVRQISPKPLNVSEDEVKKIIKTRRMKKLRTNFLYAMNVVRALHGLRPLPQAAIRPDMNIFWEKPQPKKDDFRKKTRPKKDDFRTKTRPKHDSFPGKEKGQKASVGKKTNIKSHQKYANTLAYLVVSKNCPCSKARVREKVFIKSGETEESQEAQENLKPLEDLKSLQNWKPPLQELRRLSKNQFPLMVPLIEELSEQNMVALKKLVSTKTPVRESDLKYDYTTLKTVCHQAAMGISAICDYLLCRIMKGISTITEDRRSLKFPVILRKRSEKRILGSQVPPKKEKDAQRKVKRKPKRQLGKQVECYKVCNFRNFRKQTPKQPKTKQAKEFEEDMRGRGKAKPEEEIKLVTNDEVNDRYVKFKVDRKPLSPKSRKQIKDCARQIRENLKIPAEIRKTVDHLNLKANKIKKIITMPVRLEANLEKVQIEIMYASVYFSRPWDIEKDKGPVKEMSPAILALTRDDLPPLKDLSKEEMLSLTDAIGLGSFEKHLKDRYGWANKGPPVNTIPFYSNALLKEIVNSFSPHPRTVKPSLPEQIVSLGPSRSDKKAEPWDKEHKFRTIPRVLKRLDACVGPGQFDLREDLISSKNNLKFATTERFCHRSMPGLPPNIYSVTKEEANWRNQKPSFEWSSGRTRLDPPSYFNLSQSNDMNTIAQNIKKQVGKKGPYELFTGPRDETTLHGKMRIPLPEFRYPEGYIPTFVDEILSKKLYGKWETTSKYIALKSTGLPPNYYDVAKEIPVKKSRCPFNSCLSRDKGMKIVNTKTIGPGRYNIPDNRYVNAHKNVFKSTTRRGFK